jgi:hypothetical protein
MSELSGASRRQNGSENRGIQRAAGGGTAAGGGRPAPAARCCERVFRIAGVLSPESRASPAKTRFRTSMITGVFGIDRRQTMTDARVISLATAIVCLRFEHSSPAIFEKPTDFAGF